MLVTPAGISTLLRLLQPSNAAIPMLVTPAGIFTLLRLLHPSNTKSPILYMVWLLTNFMERCKCLFMGISGVSSFHLIPRKTVKSRKNGVKNGVCLWDVCQEF